MSSYQPGIPTGTVNLDVDYLNIQANFQQLDTSFGVDHVPFSNQTAQNGYHTSIHFNPVSTTSTNPPNNQPVVGPANVPGFGQMFSAQINDGYALDEALYFVSGGNRLFQMTRNFQPVASTNGYTCLPGGIVLQWGIRAGSSSSSNPVTFNIPFTGACFNVTAIPIRSSSSPGSDFATCIVTGSVTNAGFTIGNIGGHTVANWYWMAIGN